MTAREALERVWRSEAPLHEQVRHALDRALALAVNPAERLLLTDRLEDMYRATAEIG